jgi:hypothetical protein
MNAIYFIVIKTKHIKMKKTPFFRIAKNSALLGLSMLSGCTLFPVDPPPPAAAFEAWKKPSTSADRVVEDMWSCGYRNVATANDLSAAEAATAEACMKGLGYKLDLSSYKPNNCYGQNSPYFCNRYWGGGKPAMVPVNAGGAQ